MKSTFSFSVGKIKLYAEITECYNNILYSGRKQAGICLLQEGYE